MNAQDLGWIPPLCVSAITFFGCMGTLPIPYIIMTEIFPKKVCFIAIDSTTQWNAR